MKSLVLVFFLISCVGGGGGTLIDSVTGAIVSAPPVEGGTYMFWLPWLLSASGVLISVVCLYTPDKRDDIPGAIIGVFLIVLSMAIARHGEQIADVATGLIYLSLLVAVAYFVKGLFLKQQKKLAKDE